MCVLYAQFLYINDIPYSISMISHIYTHICNMCFMFVKDEVFTAPPSHLLYYVKPQHAVNGTFLHWKQISKLNISL